MNTTTILRRVGIDRETNLHMIQTRRNVVAPINRLPFELLTRIFMHYRDMDDIERIYLEDQNPGPNPEERLTCTYWMRVITRVCTLWRMVANRYGPLWARLHINRYAKTNHIRNILKMSRKSPLDLVILDGVSKQPIIQLISNELPRIRVLRFVDMNLGVIGRICISNSSPPAPLLHTFQIKSPIAGKRDRSIRMVLLSPSHQKFFADQAPCLRILSLEYPKPMNTEGIVALHIVEVLELTFQVFEKTPFVSLSLMLPNLRELSLRYLPGVRGPVLPGVSTLKLASITKLTLAGDYWVCAMVLRILHCSNLRCLKVHVLPRYGDPTGFGLAQSGLEQFRFYLSHFWETINPATLANLQNATVDWEGVTVKSEDNASVCVLHFSEWYFAYNGWMAMMVRYLLEVLSPGIIKSLDLTRINFDELEKCADLDGDSSDVFNWRATMQSLTGLQTLLIQSLAAYRYLLGRDVDIRNLPTLKTLAIYLSRENMNQRWDLLLEWLILRRDSSLPIEHLVIQLPDELPFDVVQTMRDIVENVDIVVSD
jgi:hypothetical protein